MKRENDVQIPWEVNIKSILDSQVVTEQLQGDDIQQALQTIDSLGHANGLGALGDTLVVCIADDDGLCLSSGDLGEGGLHLGV